MKFISKFARLINEKIGESNSLALLVYSILPSNDIVFGKAYRQTKKSIDITATAQKHSLKKMLGIAIENVPFYKISL